MKVLILSVTIVLLVILLSLLYTKYRKTSTREDYALKALAAIISLITIGLTSISSKSGFVDELLWLISSLLGHPIPDPPPAPLSEKALMVGLVVAGIYAIVRSHENWAGRISADEVERQRMKKSNSLIIQGFDEGRRLISHKPERTVYVDEKRYDPVELPEKPNLVWHIHARELFELWNPNAKFKVENDTTWDPLNKCWIGIERNYKRTLFLFCLLDKPDDEKIITMEEYASSISGIDDYHCYMVFRNQDGLICNHVIRVEKNKTILLSEEYLYENIIDFSDYFANIKSRVESEYYPGSTTVLSDIYTASAVSYDIDGGDLADNDLLRYLDIWAKKPAGQHIAILGEYGQGKSTAALMFVHELIKKNRSPSLGRIPILLELRGMSPENLSTHGLLALWGQRYDIHASALMKLLINGRLILILEGFDEMSNVSSTESRLAHFRSLWRLAYPENKIIFTGRKNLFFEDKELQIVFQGAGIDESASRCKTLYLKPFDLEKISNSLRWVSIETQTEIIAASIKNSQILEVLSRPSLLFIVASLWDELRSLFDEGKVTSAIVIDKFITHSYERQEQKEKDLNFMTLTTTERRYFHEGLAAYMAQRGLTNQVNNTELRACIERLFKAYPKGGNISERVSLETGRPPLTIRMPDPEEALQVILTDVRTHGILVSDIGQRDAFRFAHKSFYELLVAKVNVYNLLQLDPVFYQSIKEANDGRISYPDKNSEILKFFCELMYMKIEKKPSALETSLSLYDLVSGISSYKNYVVRWIMRWAQIIHLRVFYNTKFTKSVFILIQLSLLFSILWKSVVVRDFMAGYKILAPYKYIEPQTSGTIGIWGMILLLLVGFSGSALSFLTNIAKRRAAIWAAVLINNDRTTGQKAGEDSIIKLLGRVAGGNLIKKINLKHSL